MSGYAASCPSCGAPITFGLGTTLLKVCEHCGVAVARKGADLESYGKVAALIPTPSLLKLGLRGDYEGAPPFTLAGRLQLDWGSGTWDEWLMAFEDESTAWLSEAQGKFHYMAHAPLPPVPRFDQLDPGETVDLGGPGTFVVVERRTARFVAAEGELPFAAPPGSELHYVDLSGPGGQLATLDFGQGDAAEALYVGREVSLGELGFEDLPTLEERRKRVGGEALSCPQCGGPLELRAPDQTQRVACPYCGSLLDVQNGFQVLEALARVPVRPLVPLGAQGTLRGVRWTVIGFMERSTTVEGVRYDWREYLLYEPQNGFRWLVEARGHWSYVEPTAAGDVQERGDGAFYRGRRFAHFQDSWAVVDHVLGEFYWAVARGDNVKMQDYVDAPLMLSREKSEDEVTWSLGTYLTPAEVREAFGAAEPLPEPEGVAPHQPWPWRDQAVTVYKRALTAVAALFLLYVVLWIAGSRTVHQERQVAIPPTAVSGAPESAHFSEPFDVHRSGNLEVEVAAPVDNSWLYLGGALVNEETGGVDEFDVEVSYYHGRDSDGSWSEGGRESSAFVGSVPPGRYVLRLEPQWEAGRRPVSYDVRVRSRVPRFPHFLLAAIAVSAFPLLLAWRHFRFEAARWSESDHPWMESE